jgi:hypothetical protein
VAAQTRNEITGDERWISPAETATSTTHRGAALAALGDHLPRARVEVLAHPLDPLVRRVDDLLVLAERHDGVAGECDVLTLSDGTGDIGGGVGWGGV